MVVCARERYANVDTAVAVQFLETVLVSKVSAAYLETRTTRPSVEHCAKCHPSDQHS